MFSLKRKRVEVPEDVIDNNQVEAFINAFMFDKNIDPKTVMITSISSVKKGEGFIVYVKAAFPKQLVLPEGRMAAMAAGLSRLLNKKLRLEITK